MARAKTRQASWWFLLLFVASCTAEPSSTAPDAVTQDAAPPQMDAAVDAGDMPPDAFVADADAAPDAGEKPELRVLFIGNSYTNANVMALLMNRLAEAEQSPVTFDTHQQVQPGANWWVHDQNQAVTDRIARGWDYVFLQDQSTMPWASVGIQQPLFSLDAKIKAAGAETFMFMTWARGGPPSTTRFRMNLAVNNYYERHGAAIGARVAPAGRAWERLLRHSDQMLHAPDNSHPSERGSYLAACVFYEMVTGASPVGLSDAGFDIPADDLAELQRIAHESIAVKRRLTTPGIGEWPLSDAEHAHDLMTAAAVALGDAPGPDGTPSGATQFGGVDSDAKYAAIPYFEGVNADHFTLAFSAHREDWAVATSSVADQTLFSKSWGYSLRQSGTTLHGTIHTTGDPDPTVTTVDVANLSSGWHAFAMTYDGIDFGLWVDGAQVTTATASGVVRYYQLEDTEDLRFNGIMIGGQFTDVFEGPTTAPGTGFNGALSNIHLFDRALDADELSGL